MHRNDPTSQELQRRRYENYQRAHAAQARLLDRMVTKRHALIRDHIPLPSEGKVLEIGCGEGVFLGRIFSPECKLFGLDLATANLHSAREILPPDASLAQGDACSLPFADNSFKFVFVNGVFHHVPDRRAMATEAMRVVAPGGGIAVIEPNRGNPLYMAVALIKAHERGLLSFSGKDLHSLFGANLVDSRLIPFSNYDFPYYGFPPVRLQSFVDFVEKGPLGRVAHTHWLFVGRKASSSRSAANP